MSTSATQPGKLQLVYEGSVKRVWQEPGSNSLLFEFTDDYSVFDWGKMPDTIANKGRALNVLGAFFFEKLGDPKFWQGLPHHPGLKNINRDWLNARFENDVFKKELRTNGAKHHFRGLLNGFKKRISLYEAANLSENPMFEVMAAKVMHPQAASVGDQIVYFYPPASPSISRRLISLEVIFRFGMPSGSSLQSRLANNPDYAHALGLNYQPEPNVFFPYPVIEFTTKLEPSDRLLSLQEALMVAQLPPDKLQRIIELTYDLAIGLYALFTDAGIELWDGKFEFITDDDAIVLADSIGPDELRLLYKGHHLSKEMLRQVYRGGAWETAVKEAKSIALKTGVQDWQRICAEQLKQVPRPLPIEIKRCADSLYPVLANAITGDSLFPGQPQLDELVSSIPFLEVRH